MVPVGAELTAQRRSGQQVILGWKAAGDARRED
jgi:hypothetical protein